MGPDKFGTGPPRDLIRSVSKRSHENRPKLCQITRQLTRDWIHHHIAKITAVFVERHVVEDESPPKSQILRNRGPVKLIKLVKIAHSFLVCVKLVPRYHFKLDYVVLQTAVKKIFETHF